MAEEWAELDRQVQALKAEARRPFEWLLDRFGYWRIMAVAVPVLAVIVIVGMVTR
jgi:hypothetical protein